MTLRAVPAALFIALAGCGTAPSPAGPARSDPNPNGLLHAMQACLASGPSVTCPVVAPALGYVVLKDDSPAKPDAWLIVPAFEVTGIEDPRALHPPVADLWRIGWDHSARLLPQPPQNRALAINSRAGRSQNLLHIHISCVMPAVRDTLAQTALGPDWRPVTLAGTPYRARTVATLDVSPFLLLASLPEAASDMADQSLAVIGAANGTFTLVTDATETGLVAETEALLDENCSGGSE